MLGLDDYGSDSDTDLAKKPSQPVSAAQPTRKTQRPKRIAIALPIIKDAPADEREDIERPTKRQKTGAGASSLLSMLPTPKQANPSLPTTRRILGGGGTVEEPGFIRTKSSIQKNLPTPTVDFFSLGPTQTEANPPAEKSTSKFPSLPYASSAPTIPTFEPPEPTPTDLYPGYYQLPSGAWAAHDSEYFEKFMKKWQEDYDAHVRALEKGVAKGFEGFENSTLGEVDAKKEMERAKKEIKEREERKAVTMGADGGLAAPRMTMTASKMSGIARSRHQLSTLLKEAYENREALEERIAQGRRNRKEAGNKYGF